MNSLIPHVAPFCMLLLGLATHVLKKFMEMRQQLEALTLIAYLKARPYKSVMATIGAMAGYLLLADASVPSLVSAFGVGYAADSMLEIVGAKARAAAK
ncbi:hypothetical protein [Chromohalobacter sp. 48-RD10]|uniref:hypothetical protein n=1 Tax=Chromohalobacter sp. 48-RD10 TaxID=2994063 RepID=UPI002468BE8C|nr:hypothetical protein [Chromohalobacter sp. 48-RD10]